MHCVAPFCRQGGEAPDREDALEESSGKGDPREPMGPAQAGQGQQKSWQKADDAENQLSTQWVCKSTKCGDVRAGWERL